MIKGKKVTCKKAEAKQGKIYVGKLPTEGVSVEDIQNYFAQVSFFYCHYICQTKVYADIFLVASNLIS